jgi:hypothetical protein
MRAHETAIAGILSPSQLARLGQIALQARGAEALREPEVVAALNLSREQRAQLRTIGGPRHGRHHGPGHDGGPPSETSGTADRDGNHHGPPPWHGRGPNHEADMQKALAVLNPEQVARWHAMTGPPFAGLSDWQHPRDHDGPREKK